MHDDPDHPRVDVRSGTGPTVLRIALGGQLRRRREAAGVTHEDAGEAIRASAAKISRLVDRRVELRMDKRYAQVMDRLCAQIEPLDRTAAILGKIRAEL